MEEIDYQSDENDVAADVVNQIYEQNANSSRNNVAMDISSFPWMHQGNDLIKVKTNSDMVIKFNIMCQNKSMLFNVVRIVILLRLKCFRNSYFIIF